MAPAELYHCTCPKVVIALPEAFKSTEPPPQIEVEDAACTTGTRVGAANTVKTVALLAEAVEVLKVIIPVLPLPTFAVI